jgi:peptide/nickel transport system permease protein
VTAPEIPVLDPLVGYDATASLGGDASLPTPPGGKGSVLVGIGLFVAGLAVVLVGTMLMTKTTSFVRVPFCLVGFGLMYKGLDRVAKWRFGGRFDTGLYLCLAWLVILFAAAILADFLPLGEHENATKTISEPGNLRPDLLSAHPLGTNNFSLDMLARCVYGARVSLLTALFAVVLSILIGTTIGLVAGYFRGWADTGIGVITDSLLAFPPLILLVALAAVLGKPTTVNSAIFKVGVALAIISVPTMTRVARANTLVFAQREFVTSARAMGAKHSRVIFRELLPNVLLPIISYSFIIVAALIVAEGSLSFLGLGLQPPKPSWGNMIAEGRSIDTLRKYPHIVIVPATVMFITVFSFNRVGEHARRLWDPRDAKV